MGSGGAGNLLVLNVELDHFMMRFAWGSRVLDSVMEEVAGVPAESADSDPFPCLCGIVI